MSNRTGHDDREVPIDALFAALGDARRQQVMFCLREQRRPMTVAELSEAVIERESGSPADVTELDDHPVTATLHHVHLPKLREAGLIRWSDDGRVAYDGSLAAAESLFDLLTGTDSLDASTP